MTMIDQVVTLSVTAAGVPVTKNLLGMTSSLSYTNGVSTATIDFAEDPGSPPYNTPIQAIAGAGTHNEPRFTGLFKQKTATLWEPGFSWVCQGKLSRVKEHKRTQTSPTMPHDTDIAGAGIDGIALPRLLGATTVKDHFTTWPVEPTDENIVRAILSYVPQLVEGTDYFNADIEGTGLYFGGPSWADLTWKARQSALDYIFNLDKVCLGYRLYELGNGRIVRTRMYGYPRNTADAVFTEGVDIWDMNAQRGIVDLVNGAMVHGYNYGGSGLVNRFVFQRANDFQPYDATTGEEEHLAEFSSPLIAQRLISQTLDGHAFLSCEAVAQWLAIQKNKEDVAGSLITYRDDLVSPGRTININAPHGIVQENVWILGSHCTVRTSPLLFQQQFDIGGGGVYNADPETGDYTPPPNT